MSERVEVRRRRESRDAELAQEAVTAELRALPVHG